MSESTQQPLTRDQLAQEYQWEVFPEAIQVRLYSHYTTFTHDGNLRLAVSDIQSASDTLSWQLQGARLDAFLSEHRGYFGQASAEDVADMVQLLATLRQKPTNDHPSS
jgi:hypothetical protein